MKLLLASRNRHKLAEFRAMLAPDILSADDVPGLPLVEETADTFEGNAILKARALALASGLWTLADDSGLEVDFLNNAPGVQSARYAGPRATDAENLQKLVNAMAGVTQRGARFRCVLALSSPEGKTRTVAGVCEGRLADSPRGENGFGYDPLFIPEGHESTFAELPGEIKNAFSHRARALDAAKAAWGAELKIKRKAKKVSLREVADMFETISSGMEMFYNKYTGEFDFEFYSSDVGFEHKTHYKKDGWIATPTRHEIHEYQIMVGFCETVKNPKIQDQIRVALRGRGAFRCFKDTAHRTGLIDQWYAFKREAYAFIAKNWCEENKLEYVDDTTRDAQPTGAQGKST